MAKQNKFGTFGGVFVPSILTILGVIMYLRLPMIIGEAGLWTTIGIIFIAHIISATTGLSVSSIATDKKVAAGGTYYMISRSLGLSIGGTLGLALFVGLSFSVSLYLIGFSESFLNYWGWSTNINNIRLTGSIILFAVTTITFISTSLAIKTQYFIMAAIALSLVSIVFGNHNLTPTAPLFSNPNSTISPMVLFGIFFPAVTGFEAGVSMSGDLKDPKSSIPFGSIMAIVVGFVVYICLAFFFAYTVDGEALRTDKNILLNIAWLPGFVIAGIWGATLSSALGSILGAPRILQATAVDKISPRFFAIGFGKTNEPRNALLLTFIIAEAGILIGELDVIARIVSIFFITTYGFLNISAAFEKWTSVDFRPEFKVSGWISLIGALACILVMIQLDFIAMLGAVIILGLLFLYLKRKELTLDSGDAWGSVWASLVKTGLTRLKEKKLHKRNWRPNIIMFSGEVNTRPHLVDVGQMISGKFGILSAFELVQNNEKNLAKTISTLVNEKTNNEYFHHKLLCREIYEGMDEVTRLYGFSGVEPNTVLMGWSKKPRNKEHFIALLANIVNYGYNTIFLNYNQERKFGNKNTIDIWWSGTGKNLAFAVNLIRFISSSYLWKLTKIRLCIINQHNEEMENIYQATNAVLSDYRIEMEINVVNNEIDKLSEKELITKNSKTTDLVVLGIPDYKYHQLEKNYDHVTEIIENLGSTLIINASENFEEINVLSTNDTRTRLSVAEDNTELTLEPLLPSKYPEIVSDIFKIDTNGQKVLEIFYKKTFHPVINKHFELLEKLKERINHIKKEIDKTTAFPDDYRKKKAIDKLKNDSFYKINTLFANELKGNILVEQTEALETGINWYETRLQEDFRKFPRLLTIKYAKEDFKIHKKDRFPLKVYKSLQLTKNWLIGPPLSHNIKYREVARFYQLNNRQVFLDKFFLHFDREETNFYKNVRSIINVLITYLDEAERKLGQKDDHWNDLIVLDKGSELVLQELKVQQERARLYEGRLQLEFRKNLQLMSNDLGKIDINYLIKKKIRPTKHYEDLVVKVLEFPQEYNLKVKTIINKVLMELSVNLTRNRIETLQEEFGQQLLQTLTQKHLKKLDLIADKVRKSTHPEELQKIKLEEDFESELQEAFDQTHEKMVALTETMPETLEIYSSKSENNGSQETLSVPVSRMAEYYLKSRYEVTVEEQFEATIEKVKRSAHAIRDLLNLTQFNLENTLTKKNGVEKNKVLTVCIEKIENEKKSVVEQVTAYTHFTAAQLEKAFEPLNTLNIEESASAFLTGLRSYQGQQVISVVSQATSKVEQLFESVITYLFYGKSEGILLAKKLNKTPGLTSINSRLLDLKEKVNPSADIIASLPPYYNTLFSSKSNISKDFWISRKREEALFSKSVNRYQQGFHGGILLLGERDSGKTAFCKHIVQQCLKNYEVYTVFPPIRGTQTAKGLEKVLQRATARQGDADQIMGQLPEKSAIVINDLELFWENTETGLEVVHLLGNLINKYGHKTLFVVNTNPHAFKSISKKTEIASWLIEIINFTPLNAKQLKELIMKRHRSSGLAIGLSTDKSPINEVQMAQLFNSYFDYSEGNPGTALSGWLANIQKVNKEILTIQKPHFPTLSILKELDEDQTQLLRHFVLHKRLTHQKIERVCNWDTLKVKSLLLSLQRAGIVGEKAAAIYQVDPYILPFLVKALRDKELLT
ncbi:MAG: amino acid permease [Bacteroidota bacterium]